MGEPKMIADTMGSVLSDLKCGGLLPDLTDEEWAARDAAVRAAQESELKRDRLRAAERAIPELVERGLSRRHVRELLAGPLDSTPAMTAIRRTDVGISVLSGNVGSGKTLAAHWWLVGDVVSASASHLRRVARMTAAAFSRASRYGGKVDTIAGATRLVLDDFGVEFLDERGSALSDFDELLNERWERELPTLITTNLSKADFKERYGARIADRIRDEGGWFAVGRESMRGGR